MKKLKCLILIVAFSFLISHAHADNNPFPNINSQNKKFSLDIIKRHILNFELKEIKNNQIRLFTQPMGVVSEIYVIDLDSKLVTIYPGTHDKSDPRTIPLDDKFLDTLMTLIASDKFKNIEQENKNIGFDGISYLLEIKINNIYSYKFHWATDDQYFMTIIKHISSLNLENNI